MTKISNENEKSNLNTYEQDATTNQHVPLEDQPKERSKMSFFTKRIKKGACIIFGMALVCAFMYNAFFTYVPVNESPAAKAAIQTRVSTTLPMGVKLMSSDDNFVGKDLTITHTSKAREANMWIWDYAAEDGDFVQVFVNGKPLGDPFMIKNTPVSFKVPTVGEIKVVGTRDGGGGITYGVYYEVNKKAYFNGMDQGGDNVYTLISR